MSKNDVTGDALRSRPASEAYRDNWEKIFGGSEKSGPSALEEKENVPDTERDERTDRV